jgi:flagellar protein FliO/FliZ
MVEELIRAGGALAVVLGLMGALALAARRFGWAGPGAPPGGAPRRLEVVEAVALDHRRRAVLLRRDGVEHLIIMGPGAETVVERIEPGGAS